jgi:hypothetical protein
MALLPLCALAVGCGSSKGPDSNDKRGAAIDCLRNEKRLDARPRGEDEIEIGNARTGPLVRFFLTRGQAEAYQFQGMAEGTIQSGSALIYVRRNPDHLLAQVESCIDNL